MRVAHHARACRAVPVVERARREHGHQGRLARLRAADARHAQLRLLGGRERLHQHLADGHAAADRAPVQHAHLGVRPHAHPAQRVERRRHVLLVEARKCAVVRHSDLVQGLAGALGESPLELRHELLQAYIRGVDHLELVLDVAALYLPLQRLALRRRGQWSQLIVVAAHRELQHLRLYARSSGELTPNEPTWFEGGGQRSLPMKSVLR